MSRDKKMNLANTCDNNNLADIIKIPDEFMES